MILVTGGAGFIGSVLISKLNALGKENICIVDRLEKSKKWLNIRGLKYHEYINADDLFNGDYDDLLNQVDMIFHLGACSTTTEMDMDYLMKNNLAYSQVLFRFATSKNIPFIYASSGATYGLGECGYDDNHDLINELMPLNPYGYSKQLMDEWVLREEAKPTHWFGLKFFNVYGPNEYHKNEMSSIVYKSFMQINESSKVKLFKSHREDFKDGEQLRDFIYVKDVVHIMILLAEDKMKIHSGILNIGTGNARSFKDLVNAVFKTLKVKNNIEYIDMPQELKNQYQYFTEASILKFKKILPHFKCLELEDGVADYVSNYLVKENIYLGTKNGF